jgi:hypothetical protein
MSTDSLLFGTYCTSILAELFRMENVLYQVEADSLLRISNTQPVLISSRLIAKGDEKFSSWFVSIRVGLADLHRSIDLIGQQMAGGVTPMRVINIDARSGDCQLVWDTGEGSIACDQATLGNALNYEVTYPSPGVDDLTYSLYQPNDAYRAYRGAGCRDVKCLALLGRGLSCFYITADDAELRQIPLEEPEFDEFLHAVFVGEGLNQ